MLGSVGAKGNRRDALLIGPVFYTSAGISECAALVGLLLMNTEEEDLCNGLAMLLP